MYEDKSQLNLTEYNSSTFLKAVHILYYEKNQELKYIADKYLCEFDKHQSSWDIALEILNKDNLENEAYYIATQIIKKKLKYDFGNFCENVDISQKLGNLLFDLLNKFKNKKLYLISNVCTCISYLIFFSHKIMPDMITLISSKLRGEDLNNNNCLVLIFSYMAELLEEEFVIDEDYFKTYIILLNNITDYVFSFLAYFIDYLGRQNINEKTYNKSIIECLKFWLSLRLNKEIIGKLENEYKIILEFIFAIDAGALENYSECICALLEKSLKNKELVYLSDFIYNRIIALRPKYISIKIRVEESIKLNDVDEIKFFIDIFQDLLSQKMDLLFDETRLDTLQLMCQLSVHAPFSKIDLITSFWQSFMYYINEKQFPKGEVLNVFNNLLAYLFRNLIKRLRFDTNVFTQLNFKRTKDIKDSSNSLSEIYHETKEIRDSLKYFFQDYSNFLTFRHFYSNYLLPEVKINIEILKEKPDNISAWASLEGCIYCFFCICNTIDKSDPEEMKALIEMMETILQIPKDIIQITRTFSHIVEHVSRILKYTEEKELLFKTLQFFIVRIDQEVIMKYISSSINDLLSENKKHFYEIRKHLMELFSNKINSKLFDNSEYNRILDGILEILSLNKDSEEIRLFLLEIIKPWATTFIQNSQKKIESKTEIENLQKKIDVIKGIIKSIVNDNNLKDLLSPFLSEVFNDLWPFIINDLEFYYDDENTIESLCQLVKYFMRGMINVFYEKFMKIYLEKIVSGYQLKPISSYIYSFEVIVDAYYNVSKSQSLLMQTFEIFCNLTFQYLPTFKSYEDNVELAEDFFGLLDRIVKVHPHLIFESQLLENLFLLATNCLNISQPETGNYVIDFLTKLLEIDNKVLDHIYKNSHDYEKILNIRNNLISQHGEKLVSKIINYIIYVPSDDIYPLLRDLILVFFKKYEKEFSQWFKNSLILIPNDCLTNSEKERYLNEIQTYNTERIKIFFDKFKRRCLSRMFRS